MNHRLAWVGRKARCPFLDAAHDYQQRLARTCPTNVILVRAGDAASESRGLLRAASKADVVIALDERGQQRTTEQYAEYFASHRHEATTFCYLVGGADGFAPEVFHHVRERWSLSAMTLPHRAVVALWLEQLYRVQSVLTGGSYHRGERVA